MSARASYTTANQFLRYAIVGIVSNGALFLLYLALTKLEMGYKLAASLAYAAGVIQTFAFNRSWSFRDRGVFGAAFVRYVAAYALGYVINMIALVVLVDYGGLPHERVQAVAIVCLAVMLFLLQKLWVFQESEVRRP